MTRTRTRVRARDRGFALIAVLLASGALGGIAYELILEDRTAIVEAQAEYDRARMEAAANSALVLTIAALAESGGRVPLDGTPRSLADNGVNLRVQIEDERGKVPLNILSDDEVRRMFQAAGARGADLDTLVDSFLDWRDDDDQRRPNGAESADYARAGYRSRDGDMTAISELARIRGMTPALLARLAPSVTIWFGESGGFAEANASPLARAAMRADAEEENSPQAIERAREARGQRTALSFEDAKVNLIGRRLTVRVTARDARGGELHRATVIEFTGNTRTPVWVRARE